MFVYLVIMLHVVVLDNIMIIILFVNNAIKHVNLVSIKMVVMNAIMDII